MTWFAKHPDEHPWQRLIDLLTVLVFVLGAALALAGLVR